MPYSCVKVCPICGSSQKDISAHLRIKHKLTPTERQRHLQHANGKPPYHMYTNATIPKSFTHDEQPTSSENVLAELKCDDHITPTTFRTILQQLSVMNLERKRRYLKKVAPEGFIILLRTIRTNVDKLNLTYEQHHTLMYSKIFKRLSDPATHRNKARYLVCCDQFLVLFSQILPQLLKL